jgi:hypothetical protein
MMGSGGWMEIFYVTSLVLWKTGKVASALRG